MEYSMLKVTTFFRKDGQFIPLDEFEGPVIDPNYIEGALSVTLYDKDLLDIALWDYIDQLWAYLVDGICAIATGESYSCYFPDQPIRIEFRIIGGNNVYILVSAGWQRTGVVNRDAFISIFSKAAMQFFKRMIKLVPADSGTFDDYIQKLTNLKLLDS